MATWYVKLPGNWHPLSFEADTEDKAREMCRAYLSTRKKECKRLPSGTEVWEHTPQSKSIIKRSWDKMRRDYARAGQIFD